jgi:uncharacterized repeat protein (TIGR01451 family)
MNMKLSLLPIILTGFLLVLPAFSQDRAKGFIELRSLAEIETEEFNEEGKKEIRRVPASKVLPGTEVIFTTCYENIGTEAVEHTVITNPVPEHMTYKDDSGRGAGARITFSVDGGKTYDSPDALFIVDADGRTYPALSTNYTHIRWTFEDPLAPGEKGEVSFTAILK